MQGCTHNTQGTGTKCPRKASMALSLFSSADHGKFFQQDAITMQHLGPKMAQETLDKVLLPWLWQKAMGPGFGLAEKMLCASCEVEITPLLLRTSICIRKMPSLLAAFTVALSVPQHFIFSRNLWKSENCQLLYWKFQLLWLQRITGIWAGLKGSETRIQIKTNPNLLVFEV